MSARLSKNQREFLEEINVCTWPTEDFPEGIPFYASHTQIQHRGRAARFYANLDARGLVTRSGNGHFFRLTDAGRAPIAKATVSAA